MLVPNQITLYRLVHVETLETLLTRGALHAPNSTPDDGLGYRTIHSVSVQVSRHNWPNFCGPGGTCHDYVPFYFGALSVMLRLPWNSNKPSDVNMLHRLFGAIGVGHLQKSLAILLSYRLT